MRSPLSCTCWVKSGETHGDASLGGVNRGGLAISPQDVMYVDEIDLARRTDPATATTARLVPLALAWPAGWLPAGRGG